MEKGDINPTGLNEDVDINVFYYMNEMKPWDQMMETKDTHVVVLDQNEHLFLQLFQLFDQVFRDARRNLQVAHGRAQTRTKKYMNL